MKTSLLVWIGFLALVLSGCKQAAPASSAGAPPAPPPVGVGVAAAADSEARFELWLLSKQPDQKTVPGVQPGKIIADSLKGLQIPPLLTGIAMSDWQARVQWSWDDMGPMEPEVQKEVAKLDEKYTSNAYSACVWPGSGLAGRVGRACVMQSYACFAARNKMDQRVLDVTVATQLHNPAAVQSIQGAGANTIGDFLRNTKFCR